MTLGDEDDALARAASAGDERAFTQLMRRHKEPIYRLLRRLTGDPDEAFDLLQETFAGLWRAMARYDGRPFGAWARGAALNRARDWGRRRTVRRALLGWLPVAEDRPLDVADASPSPEVAAGDAQALRRLDAAIARLPAKLKEPLVLTAIDGMSQADAAALLGVTAKTVETRVYRARKLLARALAED